MSRRGFLLAPDFNTTDPTPVLFEYGALEWDVLVTGRLVASSEAGLWSLRDAVQASLDAKGLGTLVDVHGRSFASMFFSRWTVEDRTDRGRVRSIGYVAQFHRFTGT